MPGATHSDTTPDQDCHVTSFLKQHDPPLLFDLEADPSETYSLAADGHPEVAAVLQRMQQLRDDFQAGMEFGESQMERGTDPALEPCCRPTCSPKPDCCRC